MNVSFKKIISQKPISSFPRSIINEVKLISFDEEKASINGSLTYKLVQRPSDIDVREEIAVCCSVDELVQYFIAGIRRIVENILSTTTTYFMEFKCGTDQIFNFDFGKPILNNYKIPQLFIDNIIFLHHRNYFNDNYYKKIIDIINLPGSLLQYETLSEIMKDLYTIRWTAEDIKNGYKILSAGRKIDLSTCLKEKGVINLEAVAVINQRLVETSNFYVLQMIDKEGKVYMVNLEQQSYDDFPNYFEKELKKSIAKNYYSVLNYNPLKMAKRMFSLARFTKNKTLVYKLVPLLSSDINIANQFKTDIATILKVIEKYPNINRALINNELDNGKFSLSNVLEIPEEILEYINKLLNEVIEGKNDLLKNLKEVKNIISEIINIVSEKILSERGLLPPPSNLIII